MEGKRDDMRNKPGPHDAEETRVRNMLYTSIASMKRAGGGPGLSRKRRKGFGSLGNHHDRTRTGMTSQQIRTALHAYFGILSATYSSDLSSYLSASGFTNWNHPEQGLRPFSSVALPLSVCHFEARDCTAAVGFIP